MHKEVQSTEVGLASFLFGGLTLGNPPGIKKLIGSN